ncbi:MAG: hypothetical protein L6R39_004029 [Caloplaca ligustica]|nr:MAG: hypothetical protein L6R39_004029 [Caloplaca ligustica]
MDAQVQPPQAPQPNFTELAECFEHAARQISRFSNIPAFNQGEVIITQLQNITQAIGDLGARFDASETNTLARLHNSAINRLDIPLYPLHDQRNNPVDGFPENGRALMQLSGNELATILQAFGQATDGNVTAKQQRFRRFIGIVTEI